MKNCIICSTEFQPYKTTQKVCSMDCAIELSAIKRKQEELKEWKKRKAQIKESLKTVQEIAKDVQKTVNKYVRFRDIGLPCVSCGKPYKKNFQAGHFYNANNHWKIRYDLTNIHNQCITCNLHLSGNLNEYRKRIIKRISIEDLERLDRIAYEPANFSREDLYKIKAEFISKINGLEENRKKK